MLGASVLVVGMLAAPANAVGPRLVDAGWGSAYGSTDSPYGSTSSPYGSTDSPYGSSGSPYGWQGGTSGGQNGTGGGQDGTGSSTQSEAATSSESRGVVLIDTQIYDGSEAAGTGLVLTSNGRVLTNYHVVEGSTAITVTVASTGKSYRATVVGADKTSDVAVLRLRNASGLTTVTPDDDRLGVGDDVTAVGNAGGTGELSAADGEVTGLNQAITTQAEDSVAGEHLKGMIETDADIVAGDSGGPLLDNEGEVVGIDTAASTGSTVDGYAIPIDTALKIVNQITSGQETSQVRIGPAAYLGVQVSDSSSTTGDGSGQYGGFGGQSGSGQSGSDPYGNFGDQFGSGNSYGGWGASGSLGEGGYSSGSTTLRKGATVVGVENGTPAASAGLAAGDVITGVGSTTIDSTSALTDALAKHQPGDQVKISWVDTTGSTQSATVTLGASPIN